MKDDQSCQHSHLNRDEQQNAQNINLHRRLRISLAILTVIVCSFNVHATTTQILRHSRNLHRSLNSQLLLHDDLSIYWFGYRTGQYLINYPIHEYYVMEEFGQFLGRVEQMMGNFEAYVFGQVNQQKLNQTTQSILVTNSNGLVNRHSWKISEGFIEPFSSNNLPSIKEVLLNSLTVQIQVKQLILKQGQGAQEYQEWDLFFMIQPYEKTTISVTIYMHEIKNLGKRHIIHFILGICTLMLIINDLRKREKVRKEKATNRSDYLNFYTYRYILYKFKAEDTPDFLVVFFLLYSSISSFTSMFTLHYILLLDGVTCFICWLYILKLYTQNDDYHISILIKKSYIFVGRLFVSFGPMFIGFCLFALTVFCRYTNLFDDFHKTFISLFCVCYYNMTYEQFRTTQRTNPISTIFFTLLIMLFTVCIYSGMLVSAFCSYMWNKRQQKNKEELLQSLKIQCTACNKKYGYAEGYKTSLKVSMGKKQSQMFDEDDTPGMRAKYRKSLNEKQKFLARIMIETLDNNMQIIEGFEREQLDGKIADEYYNKLIQTLEKVRGLLKEL